MSSREEFEKAMRAAEWGEDCLSTWPGRGGGYIHEWTTGAYIGWELRDAEVAALKAWKEAVIDQLMVAHILSAEHETDPRKALNDLITYMCAVALDPSVSSDAEALVERGKAQADATLKARVEKLEAKIPCPRPINGVDVPTDAKWCVDNGHCGCGLSGRR